MEQLGEVVSLLFLQAIVLLSDGVERCGLFDQQTRIVFKEVHKEVLGTSIQSKEFYANRQPLKHYFARFDVELCCISQKSQRYSDDTLNQEQIQFHLPLIEVCVTQESQQQLSDSRHSVLLLVCRLPSMEYQRIDSVKHICDNLDEPLFSQDFLNNKVVE